MLFPTITKTYLNKNVWANEFMFDRQFTPIPPAHNSTSPFAIQNGPFVSHFMTDNCFCITSSGGHSTTTTNKK